LIYLEIENHKKWESDVDPDDLRTVEKELVTVRRVVDYSNYEFASVAVFDLRFETRLQSGLNMARTVFVCIMLAVSSVLFSNDANHLVLEPIE